MNDIEPKNELFSVYQFFPDGSYEKIAEHVPGKVAVDTAYHYTHNVSASAGLTQRVIITDSGDFTCFEWIYGRGVVYPKGIEEVPKDYRKNKETLQ